MANQSSSTLVHRLLEVLTSLNTAYLLVSVVFADFPPLLYRFYRLEYFFDKWAGLRYTDMNPYYFTFATVTLCAAFCLWIVLLIPSDMPMAQMFLYSGAGLSVIFRAWPVLFLGRGSKR